MGRVARERDRKDAAGIHMLHEDQMEDLLDERFRLPRTGPGEDQEPLGRFKDGGSLLGVKIVEEGHSNTRIQGVNSSGVQMDPGPLDQMTNTVHIHAARNIGKTFD